MILTLYFNDQGQRFLEWDVQDGLIIESRPHDRMIWKGGRVMNKTIKPGDTLMIELTPGRPRALIYPVAWVRNWAGPNGATWQELAHDYGKGEK